jgi:glycerol-3-phosphate dehydrogenase
VAERGLSGGAIWYDYQTRHPDRLTWTVALAARQTGAVLANYVRFVRPERNAAGRVTGAELRDELTGEAIGVDAGAILVAAGAGAGEVLESCGVRGAPPLLRAMNVLLNRPARDIAVVARSRSGRMLTAVPWRGWVLVGTDQSTVPVAPPEASPPQSALEAFLADLNTAFPAVRASLEDVRLVHHGLVPAIARAGRVDLMPEPRILRHGRDGVTGLVSLAGVKYTTARLAAAHAVDAVLAELGRPHQRSRTGSRPLPYAEVADVEGRLLETARARGIELDRDVIEHLQEWYGTEAPAVLEYSAEAGLLERLTPGEPLLAGEVAYAVELAQAVRLSDTVLRRTPLGSAGHPGRDALDRAAGIMALRLGWSDARRAEEIAQVEKIYLTSGVVLRKT